MLLDAVSGDFESATEKSGIYIAHIDLQPRGQGYVCVDI